MNDDLVNARRDDRRYRNPLHPIAAYALRPRPMPKGWRPKGYAGLPAAPLLPVTDDPNAHGMPGTPPLPAQSPAATPPRPEMSFTTDPDSYLQPEPRPPTSPTQGMPPETTSLPPNEDLLRDPSPLRPDTGNAHPQIPPAPWSSPARTGNPASPETSLAATREWQQAHQRLQDFTAGGEPYLLKNGDPMKMTPTVRGDGWPLWIMEHG